MKLNIPELDGLTAEIERLRCNPPVLDARGCVHHVHVANFPLTFSLALIGLGLVALAGAIVYHTDAQGRLDA